MRLRRPAVVGQRAEDGGQGGGIRAVAGGQDVGGAGGEAVERLGGRLAAVANQVEGVELDEPGARRIDFTSLGGAVARDQVVAKRRAGVTIA